MEKITILDGAVRLFKRPNSSKWQARIKVTQGHVELVSTGETNVEFARERATARYYELVGLQKAGRDITAKRFKDVAQQYILSQVGRVSAGELSKSRVTRLNFMLTVSILPKFGAMRITEVNSKHIAIWRTQRQFEGGVKSSTLAGELGLIRRILEFGAEHGYCDRAKLPVVKRNKVTYDRHPAWTLPQYLQMMRNLRDYVSKAGRLTDRYAREELYDYMQFMIASGLRPVEATNLRWCDVSEKGNTLALNARGKDHAGTCITRPIAKRALARIRQRRTPRLPTEHVFLTKHNRKMLQNFLTAYGAQFDSEGERYCPYSTRHTYATLMLEHKTVEIYQLAKNMRTSVQMIEQHYGHLEPVRVWQNFV